MAILSGLSQRLKYLRAIYKEGVLGRWAGAIWLLLGIASTAKTELLSPELQARWQFIHMVPTISLAWWVAIFAFLLFLWAIEASFQHVKTLYAQIGRTRDEAEALASSNTTLKVELRQTDQTSGNRSHRIGVTNLGSVVAKNVKVWLREISPRPLVPFRNDFPYRVARADAAWSIYSTIPIEDVDINPNEEELFQIFESWLIGDQSGELAMQGIDTKKNGNSYPLRVKPGSAWVLTYEISSANAPSIRFPITANVGNKIIATTNNS